MYYLFDDILYELYYVWEEVWTMFMLMNIGKLVLVLILAMIFWGKLKEERDRRIYFLSSKIGEINAHK